MGDPTTVDCCPECESQRITRRVGGVMGDTLPEDAETYRCNVCSAVFDDPSQRERSTHSPTNGTIARSLDAADPDTEIRAKEGESP